MANKVQICTDSSCDLSPELLARYDIRVVPLYVVLEDRSLKDNEEITPDELFRVVEETQKIPKTAAPAPADYLALYRDIAEKGREVVHICLNAEFSASYQNACIAAREVPGVYPIDSQSISTAIGLLVLRAAEMAGEGHSAKEIADAVTAMRAKLNTQFVLDTLDYAAKGGRCSVLLAFGANLLRLRPCLQIKNGILGISKKFRGSLMHVAEEYTRYMLSVPNIDYRRVFVSYTTLSREILDNVVSIVKDAGRFQEVLVTRTGCTVAIHGGPGTLAVFYMTQ